MKRIAWLVMVLAACGDDGATPVDAAIDAPTMCPAKTAPLAPGMHTIYLNFDGVTLTKGNDDSATNTASVLVNATATIPAYVATGNPTTRQGRIDEVVGYVQRSLAPYSVDVVTTRPASGPYMMNVIGGKPEDFGFQAGNLSIVGLQCGRTHYNGVALEFEPDANYAAIDYASTILSDVGVMVGMGLTTRLNGCMTRIAPGIEPGTLCTFNAMSPTSPDNNCGNTPTQDELLMLLNSFGCRD